MHLALHLGSEIVGQEVGRRKAHAQAGQRVREAPSGEGYRATTEAGAPPEPMAKTTAKGSVRQKRIGKIAFIGSSATCFHSGDLVM